MPASCEMIGDLLHVTFTGFLTPEELIQTARQVADLESRLEAAPNRITDLTAVTDSEIGSATVQEVAALRRRTRLPNPIRSALVAPLPVHMGFARMFQTLNDHPQITMQVFRDRSEALAWLAQDSRQPAP